jgi:hypothetical protein
MKCKVTLAAAAFAALAATSVCAPAEAGTCKSVRAKGWADTLSKATLYAQADLHQTVKSMKGKVTQATTKCGKVMGHFHCVIEAVVCPK